MNISIPSTSILANLIEIDGYKFFYFGEKEVQCATCLSIMGIVPGGKSILGKVRKIILIKDCDCPRQK